MHKHLLTSVALGCALLATTGASAQEKLGDGMVVYFQMGGTPGGGATLPRTNGARAAAEAFGVDLREQYSSWHPETMLDQFREAMAASPDCIEIMGHPGEDAWEPLVAEAREQGIVVTSGNASIPRMYEAYQAAGFGYVGVELYAGGWLTGKKMVEHGYLIQERSQHDRRSFHVRVSEKGLEVCQAINTLFDRHVNELTSGTASPDALREANQELSKLQHFWTLPQHYGGRMTSAA